jgi:hypothetical protein
MRYFTVGTERVKKLLLNLNTNKALGPDNIPTQLLKDYVEDIIPALTSGSTPLCNKQWYLQPGRRQMYHLSSKKGDCSHPATPPIKGPHNSLQQTPRTHPT